VSRSVARPTPKRKRPLTKAEFKADVDAWAKRARLPARRAAHTADGRQVGQLLDSGPGEP
jgi:hypothetical protein